MKPDYADILILTDLFEERFLLDRVLVDALRAHYRVAAVEYIPDVKLLLEYDSHKAASQKSAGFACLKLTEHDFLKVDWTNLDGPGNVWAYDETSQLIELLAPRFVLLVGVAGGNIRSFQRGDVGYGSVIANSSYGKVQSESILKRLQGLNPDESKKQAVRTLCEQLQQAGIDPQKTVFTDITIRSSERVDATGSFRTVAKNQHDKPEKWGAFPSLQRSPRSFMRRLRRILISGETRHPHGFSTRTHLFRRSLGFSLVPKFLLRIPRTPAPF